LDCASEFLEQFAAKFKLDVSNVIEEQFSALKQSLPVLREHSALSPVPTAGDLGQELDRQPQWQAISEPWWHLVAFKVREMYEHTTSVSSSTVLVRMLCSCATRDV